MAKLDAPAMAAAVVARTERIEPCLGPLAVTVRSPAQIALAAATVAATGRRTHVALGTSSDVVARWHGRDRRGAADRLRAATARGPRAARRRARRRLPPAPAAAGGDAHGRRVRTAWPSRSPAPPTGWCSTWSPCDAAAALAAQPSQHGRLARRGRRPDAGGATVDGARVRRLPRRAGLRRDVHRRRVRRRSSPSPAPGRTRASSPTRLPAELLDAVALVGTEAEVRRRGSTPTPPPASPRSASSCRRSTRRRAAGPSRPSRHADQSSRPSVAAVPAQPDTRTASNTRMAYNSGRVDVLAEEEAAGGLVQLRRHLQVLGRHVGVALAALQHARAVHARPAGERVGRVGDLGAALRGVGAGEADADAGGDVDPLAGDGPVPRPADLVVQERPRRSQRRLGPRQLDLRVGALGQRLRREQRPLALGEGDQLVDAPAGRCPG